MTPVPALWVYPDRNPRDRTGKTGGSVKLKLTDEERRALPRLVRDALDASRFPLSPESETLRELADKLRDA